MGGLRPAEKAAQEPSPAAGVGTAGKPAAATINREQAEELQRLLQENRAIDPAKFLARFKAGRLSEIPAQQFASAVTVLKSAAAVVLHGSKQPA